MNQSLSEVMQNQSNSLITLDTQLKTALLDSDRISPTRVDLYVREEDKARQLL